MSFDRFLMVVESSDLSQADMSLITVSFFQSCPIFSSHQQVIIYRHFSGSVLLGALLITKEKETMQKDVWR